MGPQTMTEIRYKNNNSLVCCITYITYNNVGAKKTLIYKALRALTMTEIRQL